MEQFGFTRRNSEPVSRGGPMRGIAIGVPISIALWAAIAWLIL